MSVVAVLERQVETSDDRVGVVDGDRAHVGEGLDLGGPTACQRQSIREIHDVNVHFLDLVVGHDKTQLANTGLDSVPAGKTRGEVDVAGEAKVLGVENLVGRGVVEDGLGVDTGLVGEGAEAGDGVVEGSVDLDGLGDEILNLHSGQYTADGTCSDGAKLTSLIRCSLYLLLT